MWKKIAELFEAGAQDGDATPSEDDIRTAIAALLVHASRVDGEVDTRERERLFAVLKARFELDDAATRELVDTGREEDAQAVDLYRFTRVLTDRLDHDGRVKVVEMLWEVVLSDGVIDDFEANLVWRVSELLHVPTRERVTLRREVAARFGLEM